MEWTKIELSIALSGKREIHGYIARANLCERIDACLRVRGLKFVLHLVMARHQPLEVGYRNPAILTIIIPKGTGAETGMINTEIAVSIAQGSPNWTVCGPPLIFPNQHGSNVALERFLSRRSDSAELRVQFLTPASRKRLGYVGSGEIDPAIFLRTVEERLRRMVGSRISLPDSPSSLIMLGHYVLPSDGHTAKSNDRARLHGNLDATDWFVGPLFLRNPSLELVNALWDLQEFHVEGLGRNAWRGFFRLGWQTAPMLDRELNRIAPLVEVATATLRKNDVNPVVNAAGELLTPHQMADTIRRRLKEQNFSFQPSRAVEIAKARGGKRTIEQLETLDLILQRRLLDVLTRGVETLLSESALGFRRGHGRDEAVSLIRQAISEGFHYVLESDIEDCFPSIQHARLLRDIDCLLIRADIQIRSLLERAIRQSVTKDGVTRMRDVGLAQGAPLSPLFMNLYLRKLDVAFNGQNVRPIRYADDLAIMCRTRNDAQQALEVLHRMLGTIELKPSLPKTGIVNVKDGFNFLGERFDLRDIEDPMTSILAQRKPLVITQPYVALGANGDALEARVNGALLATWPLRRLSEVILLNRASISTAAIERCGKHGVPLAIAINGGKSLATLRPQNRSFHQIAFAHGQWFQNLSNTERLAFAQAIVRAKLHNYSQLVEQRRKAPEVQGRLLQAERMAASASGLDQLRGVEGNAARVTFAWFRQQIIVSMRADFNAKRRERGAPDRLNSALNFAYFLLFARMNGIVRSHGLNPYLGLLHDGEEDYETLVYDMVEPFRPFVDRMIIRMINRKELRAASFGDGEPQFRLNREAIQSVVRAFEETMRESMSHSTISDVMLAQVRSLRKLVLGEGPFWQFRWMLRSETKVGDALIAYNKGQ